MRDVIGALRGVPLDVEIVISLETGGKGFLVPIEAVRLAPVVRDREVTSPRWYLPARAQVDEADDNRTEEFVVVVYPR